MEQKKCESDQHSKNLFDEYDNEDLFFVEPEQQAIDHDTNDCASKPYDDEEFEEVEPVSQTFPAKFEDLER